MQFGEQNTDFEQADRRFQELRRQRDTNAISDQEFDAQLQELMVRDGEGRWWTKDRNTGGWVYHDGTRWVPGTPPGSTEWPSDSSYGPDPGVGPGPGPGTQPAGVPIGLWIGLGFGCAFLALILSFLGFPFGIAGIVFGVLTMRRGSRGVGTAIVITNAVVMFLWILIFLVAGFSSA